MIMLKPYERQVQQQYPYQYTEIARPPSNGFETSADLRSSPYYNSSNGASASNIASKAPQSNDTGRSSTSSEFSHTHVYARQASSAPQVQFSSHHTSASTSGYQASASAVSMTLPPVTEDKQRSKSSTTPTPIFHRSQSRAAYSSQDATNNIDPALTDHSHAKKDWNIIAASATGNVTELTAQQNQHTFRPDQQSSAQQIYAQMEPVQTAPPSISAQIERLVFHVSPLCPLEELDFAFYLACCWNDEPSMLRSTCALYQQWVSAYYGVRLVRG